MVGDPSKAKNQLGWKPEYNLNDIVKDMMDFDLQLMQKDKYLKNGGFKIQNFFE